MTTHQEIFDGMARAFFVSAYAEAWDDAKANGMDTDLNPSGQDWMDLAPEETDPAAIHAAKTLMYDLQRANLYGEQQFPLDVLYFRAQAKHAQADSKGDRELTPELFGHYLAMQAMGHGVGLESFGNAVRDAIQVPYVEFGSHSLERDYFLGPFKDGSIHPVTFYKTKIPF